MTRTTTTATTIAMAIAATATIFLAACGKTEQISQPGTTAPATPASAPDTRSKDDLARIRELMEKEEARKQAQETKAKSLAESQKAGNSAPLNTFGR